MKTTLFLLSLLLLSLPAKAQGGGTDPEKTFWHDQLTDVSVGSSSDSPTDVALSVTDNDTTYTVKTAKGLAWIAKVTNDGLFYKADDETNTANYPHRAGFEGCTVELYGSLTDDSLSLRDHYWTPIGDDYKYFKGAFDGNHKLVAGLKADTTVITQNTSTLVGLFGYIRDASVSNVGVWVTAEGINGNSNFDCCAGGIAGYSYRSTIRNCFVSGDAGATIKGEGTGRVGGIVGYNYGTVENCYATVDVSASGSESIYVGGIAGTNGGGHSITSVYATGKVTGTSSNSNCYVGGITGSNPGTLSKALALNKEGSDTPGTKGDLYLGRISGNKGFYSSFSQCYASTKIDTTATRQDTYFDGTDASVATDLSLLFPTSGEGAVWTSNSTDNLPQLSTFSAASAGNPGQPALAKADYLEELPLGKEGNPYVIDISSVSSGDSKNQYNYSNGLITLLKPDSCYLIKGKNSQVRTLTLTPETGTPNDPLKPYHLYAQAGCALDTLLVPAGTACIIQGDNLRSKSCQVRGGTLTMEVPVVLEMPETSGDNNWQNSSLYIDGGSVTVNDTLRAYASGSSHSSYGIFTQSSSSKLKIGSKGVVYAYGGNWGCSLYSNSQAEIENGGILRVAAGTVALVAGSGALSFPAIQWKFDYTPDARLTLKKEGSNEVAATFSEKVFSSYFGQAKQFVANVEGNTTTYNLYLGESATPLNGRKVIKGSSVAAFTNKFTAPESGELQSYSYVGLPMETSAPDSITLTKTCTYRKDKAGTDTHFDNVLSCTMKKLRITSIGANEVLLNGVNITDSLLVKGRGVCFYLLKPENGTVNTLGNVRVENGGDLTLKEGGGGTLASAMTFVNSGTFIDNINLVDKVKASIAPGDTLLVSRPSVSGTTEVAPGGTTTLTAAGVSEWQQGANSSDSPTYNYYWQEWKEEGWKDKSDDNSSQIVGKGKYRCQVKYTLSVDYESVRTALYSLPVEVTEKSAPPYIPPVVSYYTVTLPEVEGARLDKTGSHTVEEGYSFPFRLTLDADYDRSQPVVSIDRHGTETLTPEVLADGSLKYRIRDVEQDLTVSITGIVRNDDPTATGSVPAADVRVRSFGNLLHITVPAPTSARLYDFHGRLLRTALLPAGSSTMPKPAGPCIVVLGGESFKVGD